MSRTVTALVVVLAIAISLASGYWLGQRKASTVEGMSADSMSADAMSAEAGSTDEKRALYWYDPMVPDQRFDRPGKSPFMDMMLVPRYADEAGEAGVTIDPGIRQNLGIRTALVELDAVADELRVPGTLQWDLRGEQRITARVEGLVERVHVRTPFQRVRRGEALATLLAPALGSALAEYRALAAGSSAQARELQTAARSRLQILGLGAADLRSAGTGVPRITLRAPADGVLAEIAVRAGDTVMAGQRLLQFNSTESIWLDARVPQADAGGLRPGAVAEVMVSAFPGLRFDGTVEAVLPDVDAMTRTQAVRIVLPNPDGRLAAGMFADAVLRSEDGRRCPWVPSEALILTGREARVIVRDDDGSFRPVRVQTGREVGGRTEILDGLDGGETVVVSGQFLIDSEASLSGLLTRLEGGASNAEPQENAPSPHAGHGATDVPASDPKP
jgi:Cu(I)/Ag(I) efflux system membrane fusion protein